MPTPESRVEDRLTDLEVKASFTEELVEQLNQVIVRQQEELTALARQIRNLRAQWPEPGTGQPGSAQDDSPPHY